MSNDVINYNFKYNNKYLTKREILDLYLSFVRCNYKINFDELISKFGSVKNLFEASIEDLLDCDKINLKEAVFIKMVYEVAKACSKEKYIEGKMHITKEFIYDFVKNKFVNVKYESSAVILLNKDMKILEFEFINRGSFNTVNVYPRDIIYKASKCFAKYAIIIHNHPSGNCIPSSQDIINTKRIYKALKVAGISLLDHYIIGKNQIESLSGAGVL